MTAIHIRNVPESTVSALRERAERNGRSMQQEIREILRSAASEPVQGEPAEPIRLVTVSTPGTSTLSREEIYGDQGR